MFGLAVGAPGNEAGDGGHGTISGTVWCRTLESGSGTSQMAGTRPPGVLTALPGEQEFHKKIFGSDPNEVPSSA
jgi:hypothetical protein